MRNYLWPLAVAQTIFWASTFYLIPALLPALEQSTKWTKAEISFAMTCALLTSALASPFVGKLIDLGYGRRIMPGAGVLAAIALIGFSQSSSAIMMILCWIVIGACMAACLYEPCFAIVTRHLGANAKPAITRVTLVAGFAGTVSFPVSNAIVAAADWRLAVLFFALLTAFVAVPLAYYGIGQLEKQAPFSQEDLVNNNRPVLGKRVTFWLLAISFGCAAIAHGMVVTHLLPLLSERGLTTSLAVIIAMIIGPMQVVGRAIIMVTEKRVSNSGAAVACFIGLPSAGSLLYVAGSSFETIAIFAGLLGASWGIVTIIRPPLARAYLGQDGFGLTTGRLAAIFTLGFAIAPYTAANLWKVGGYDLMLQIAIGLFLTGGILLWFAHLRHTKTLIRDYPPRKS